MGQNDQKEVKKKSEPRHNIRIRRIRRQIEDWLRKEASEEDIEMIAQLKDDILKTSKAKLNLATLKSMLSLKK